MESFFSRFKNPLVLIAVLLAQTIGLAIQVRRPVSTGQPDGQRVFILRHGVAAVVTPFERFTQSLGSGVSGTWRNYVDLRHVRQQNEALRQQIAEMRLEQAAFAEDAMQGHRLQALLNFQQHYISKTVAAQVIGTSGSDLSRILTLDKGAADGLKPDMAVITPEGVVGKLRDVFPHSSQLLLLDDQTAGAGVILQSTRIRAVIRGTPAGKLQIVNLTADSRIKPGETVLTSGGDMVYPRGLPVGTIESVTPDLEHQPYVAITVKPSASLSRLEEVLVITQMQGNLSPEAERDLAQGAATADAIAAQAESVKAADLFSEKLPGLEDLDPKADADGKTPATQEPGGAVPKPLPTLHVDHFTPGTTPPAADLTPGARAPEGRVNQTPTEPTSQTPQRRPRTAPAQTNPPTSSPEQP